MGGPADGRTRSARSAESHRLKVPCSPTGASPMPTARRRPGERCEVGRHRRYRAPERHRLGGCEAGPRDGRDRSVVRGGHRLAERASPRPAAATGQRAQPDAQPFPASTGSTSATVGPASKSGRRARRVPGGEQAPVARVSVAHPEGAAGAGAQQLAEAQSRRAPRGGRGQHPSAAMHRGPGGVRTPHRSSVTSAGTSLTPAGYVVKRGWILPTYG